ncbi:MAG: PKD domain-containing protein, partial [Lewinella sp.]|nr:PKD domain-containing protein [Lewinella sp.]
QNRLRIGLASDYDPAVGSSFDIITTTGGTVTGPFQNLSLPPFPGCTKTWQIEYQSDRVIARVVPLTFTTEITATPDAFFTCASPTITLTASTEYNGNGFVSYQWNTGQTGTSINVFEANTYSVTVSDGAGGCSTEANILITNGGDVPTLNISASDTEISDMVPEITLTAMAGNITGSPAFSWSTGDTGPTTVVISAGEYSVTVTDEDTGCTTVSSISIGGDYINFATIGQGNWSNPAIWDAGAVPPDPIPSISTININHRVFIQATDNPRNQGRINVNQGLGSFPNYGQLNLFGGGITNEDGGVISINTSSGTAASLRLQGSGAYLDNQTGAQVQVQETGYLETVASNNPSEVIITNSGTIVINGSLRNDGGTLNNQPGGLITNNGLLRNSADDLISNEGTIDNQGSGNNGLTNYGTISSSNGTFTSPGVVRGNGSQETGNAWGLSGELQPVTASNSPGQYAITGDVDPTGTFRLRVGGASPGVNQAQVNVDGNADLTSAGLVVELESGFTPSLGNSFELVTITGALTGPFTSINLPALADCNTSWDMEYQSDRVVLSVVPGPAAVIAPPATTVLTCDDPSIILDASASTGPAGLQFAWQLDNMPLSTEAIVEATVAGTYTLTVTDPFSGCTKEAQIDLTQDSSLPEAAIDGPTQTLTCSAPSITLTAGSSNITGTPSYSWSDGSTNATLMVNSPGDYGLTVTDSANGCTGSTTISIGQNIAAPVADITAPTTELPCDPASVMLDASGSTSSSGNLAYAWTEGSSGPTLTVTSAGTYTVTVTDPDNGCTSEASFTITPNTSGPTAIIAPPVTTELTCTLNEISLDAAGSTTTGTPSYAWSDNSSDPSLAATSPGIYTVTVTDDANGCTSSTSIEITQDVQAPTAAILASDPELTCTVTSVDLDASSSTVQGTASYLWDDNSTGPIRTVAAAGNYSLTVTDSDNGCTATNSIMVAASTDLPMPSINASGSIITCTDQEITLTASSTNVTGTAQYSWDGGQTGNSITVDAAGNYGVTVTDAATGCTGSVSFMVDENTASPTALIDAPTTELPCDPPSITLDAGGSTSGGAPTYAWTGGGSGSTLVVDAPGTYTVTVTDTDNGCTDETSIMITPNASAPMATIAMPATTELTCLVTDITLDASGSSTIGAATYAWSDASGNATLSVMAPGTYAVTVTDGANGCTNATSIEITQDILAPTATISPSAPELTCIITTIALDATGSTVQGAASYLWSDNSDAGTLTIDAPGTYAVTVTDSDNGCTANNSIEIGQNSVALNISGQTTVCEGDPIMLAEDAGDATGWNWSGPDFTGSASTVDIATAGLTDAGTYTLTVTDATGCTAIGTVDVTVNATPAMQLTSNAPLCAGGDLTLEDTGGLGTSFVWSGPASFSNSSAMPTINTVAAANAGTYELTIIDANGCTNSASLEVVVWPNPVIEIASNTPVCHNEEVELSATGGTVVGWQWALPGGATEANPSVMIPYANALSGIYTVTGTDGNGCSTTETTDVVLTPDANIGTNFLVGSMACLGEELRFIDYSDVDDATLANSTFSWDFGDGVTSTERDPVHSYSAIGSYDIQVDIVNNACSYLSISKTVTIVNCLRQGGLPFLAAEVYPTPSDGQFTLAVALRESSDLRLELCDPSGQVLQTEYYQDIEQLRKPFDIARNGVYLIRLRHRHGTETLRTVVFR